MLSNFLESFLDHVFRDDVIPIRGSIVKCDLALGKAEHTGIYIGHNTIVELTGDGYIRAVNYHDFLHSSEHRTGIAIYVACGENKNVIHRSSIADRAESKLGYRRNYNLLVDNCHQFTAGCITGDFENGYNTFENMGFLSLSGLIRDELNGGKALDWRRVKLD